MDVKNNRSKYLKLVRFLRKEKLGPVIKKRKGCLSKSIVKAQKAVNTTFSESSVEKLDTILQKHWEKIHADVVSNAPAKRIITISKANTVKVKEESCEAITNYVIKTKDSDFLNGKIKYGLIKKALMEHKGVSTLSTNTINDCRLHVHVNYRKIKEEVMNRLEMDDYSDYGSNWSEVSDYDAVLNLKSNSATLSTANDLIKSKIENNFFDETQSLKIKKEIIENEKSTIALKELIIPLKRVTIPPKRIVSVKSEKNAIQPDHVSPWFRLQSDDEYLRRKKSEFVAVYQQKKIKLITDVEKAIQTFTNDFDDTVQELFSNIEKHYRKQPTVKAL